MHVLDPASALPSILFILLLDIMVSPETENVVPYKIMVTSFQALT